MGKPMQIWIRNILSLHIYGVAICGLRHQGNLRICDLRINDYKLADFRFPDWHTSEICRFAIAEWVQEFADFWLAECWFCWITKKIACPAWFSSVLPLIGINTLSICICLGWLSASVKGTVSQDGYFWRYFLWRPWWFSMSFKSFSLP